MPTLHLATHHLPLTLSVLELERDLQAHTIRFDLAVRDRHVLLADLGDAEIPERRGSTFYGRRRGFLPGRRAGADDLDDLVDAFCHVTSLLCTAQNWRTGALMGAESPQ